MSVLWLSRARLRRDAAIATLAPLLLPEREDDRVASQHRLIWSLFSDESGSAKRDFLWRDDHNGSYYIFSCREPARNHPLFEVDTPKRFTPALAAGDRLRFSLRANPTIARPTDEFRTKNRPSGSKPSRKTAHHDIVMHALHKLPAGARADARTTAIEVAGRKWLESQGERCGFALPGSASEARDDNLGGALRVDGYRVLRPPRPSAVAQMRIAVLEFEGVLTVTRPELFSAALGRGFGRAKAYGCGLMLIARV